MSDDQLKSDYRRVQDAIKALCGENELRWCARVVRERKR